MNSRLTGKYYDAYRRALLSDCVPFWEKHSPDREKGGFFTCLDRKGDLYSTEKSVWFQGRQAWMFARLYNEVEKRPEWLELSKLGCDFLKTYGFDSDGKMFFTTTREGVPTRKRRYNFSETFATIAFAEYYRATKDPEALAMAQKTFGRLLDIYEGRVKTDPKYLPSVPVRGANFPMILLNTVQVLRDARPDPSYEAISRTMVADIVGNFINPEKKAMFENVNADGTAPEGPMGRLVNPGHSIEAAWFLMKEGQFIGDKQLVDTAAKLIDWSFERGWDKQYGGLYAFMDAEGRPPQQYEWDMKIWWPQTEALIAMVMAYNITGDETYAKHFETVHQYCSDYFVDKEYGEWYGYLHRDNTISIDMKGSLWKGFFHIPRALMFCMQELAP